MPGVKGLKQRLADGEDVLCAEGFLFEMERRGYLKAGPFTPEVVLENPERLRALHEEFAHAGSDVVEAFTYYGHREKLRHVDREDDIAKLNLAALKIAREVADKTGTLMAGNICNSAVYDKDPENNKEETKAIFKEQIEWAVQGGADFVIGETFFHYGEAELALEMIQKHGQGLPAVINVAPLAAYRLADGVDYDVACKRLEDKGADVVGLNCSFGPATIIPEIKKVRQACKGPIACLPVPFRTTPEHPMMQSLLLPDGRRAFFENLDHFNCGSEELRWFGEQCKEIGVQFAGICCGNSSRYFRAMAEGMGRTPPASKYSPDMSKHYIVGNDPKVGGGLKFLNECWLGTENARNQVKAKSG